MATTWQVAMWIALAAVAGGLGQTALAAEEPVGNAKTLQVEGSTTVGPIADEFAAAFKKLYPELAITVNKPGSGPGIAALIDGRCQIATASRFMKPEEFKKAVDKGQMPVAHAIAMDGVCVILHPSNPIKALKPQQLNAIYTGKVTNWKDLGGPDKPIVVISRETSSGTYECFNEFVMGKDKMFEKVTYVSSNPEMHNRVAATEGAIGYVGLGFVDDKVKALVINGVAPSRKTVQSGQYPFSRSLYLFTNGYPELNTPIHAFCTFYLTEKGQQIIEAAGFVPLTNY